MRQPSRSSECGAALAHNASNINQVGLAPVRLAPGRRAASCCCAAGSRSAWAALQTRPIRRADGTAPTGSRMATLSDPSVRSTAIRLATCCLPFTDRYWVDFRAGIFNLANTPPFGFPGATVGTAQMGSDRVGRRGADLPVGDEVRLLDRKPARRRGRPQGRAGASGRNVTR